MSKFYLASLAFHISIFGFLIEKTVELPSMNQGKSLRISLASAGPVGEGQAPDSELYTANIEESAPEVTEVPAIQPEPIEQPEKVETVKAVEEIKPVEVVAKAEPVKPEPVKKPEAKKTSTKKASKSKTQEKKIPSLAPAGSGSDEFLAGGRFALGSDGVYTASSSEGIEYEFIRAVDPAYPSLAKKMRYRGEAVVKTKFLVGLTGEIEKIEVVGGIKKFGFREEAEKALSQWKFKPIFYKGKNIKVYFYKDFKFKA